MPGADAALCAAKEWVNPLAGSNPADVPGADAALCAAKNWVNPLAGSNPADVPGADAALCAAKEWVNPLAGSNPADCARGGIRTRTPFRTVDFESTASAIPPPGLGEVVV